MEFRTNLAFLTYRMIASSSALLTERIALLLSDVNNEVWLYTVQCSKF